MRKLTLILGIVIVIIAVIAGTQMLSKKKAPQQAPRVSAEQQTEDFQKAQELLNNQEPEEALEIIQQYKPEMESQSPQGLKWMELFIKGSVDTRDVQQLVILYEFFPEIFKDHEDASLLVADAYITKNNTKNYKKIRSLWTDRETKVAAWFVLDSDELLLEGRRQEAIQKLKSRSFNNKADVGRLVRLALLYGNEDPKRAWAYLAEAYGKDPQNPDVRSYRAKLLESVGKNTLAHQEYKAAVRTNPSNLFLKNQLADFYLRHRQYLMALDLMKTNLPPPSLDSIWVKSLFWSKVATPIPFDWTKTPIPDGKFNAFVQYLINLPPNTFWDQKTFEHTPNSKYFLKTLQETFWLRLLQAFKDQKEEEAEKLLRYNPFAIVSWYPQLEAALKRVMNYRQNQTLKLDVSELPPEELLANLPQIPEPTFFQELAKFAQSDEEIPQPVHNLLMGKDAFAAVFLAAGWSEAGLQLNAFSVIPDGYPDWLAFAITQALYHNRSSMEALEFAKLQKRTPQLKLLTAELTIANGDKEAGLKELLPLAKENDEIGFRAAWLASLLYIENKEYDRARTVITSQPLLIQDILGQETLARIAFLEGDQKLADKLYRSIETKSPEARSYLARKAFQEKNWKRARELTEQLIVDYPENQTLKENLQKIIEQEQQPEK